MSLITRRHSFTWKRTVALELAAFMGLMALPALAQTFDSESTGADGAFDLTDVEPGTTIVFDPVELGLDLDEDNVFHFTTINIPAGVTVRLSALQLGTMPVYWLSTGPVIINGVVNLNGEHGKIHSDCDEPSVTRPTIPGAGGFPGGVGACGDFPAQGGFGPGGGPVEGSTDNLHRSAAHADRAAARASLGSVYGNIFLLPLLGGSGGAGWVEGSGGAGGGAILIASSQSIELDGTISALGGGGTETGGRSGRASGTGSGGAIRLVAPVVRGSTEGSMTLQSRQSALGRVRIEAFEKDYNFRIQGAVVTSGTPLAVFLPRQDRASIRVARVNGHDVPTRPRGLFTPADVEIESRGPAPIEIVARSIPPGTVAKVLIFSENGQLQEVESTPLDGTFEFSTATAEAVFEHGFSRFFVYASWDQTQQ